MTFEEIPKAIKDTLECRVRAALPNAAVYQDLVEPGTCKRPAVLLMVGRARELAMDRTTVTVGYDVTVTGLVEVARNLRGQFTELDRMGGALLAAFLTDRIIVGGIPMGKSPAQLDLHTLDGAELSFTLSARLNRADQSGQDGEAGVLMEQLHTRTL